MENWIKVTNKLPPENERVIVCCTTKKGVRNINLAYHENGFWHGNGSMAGVTHWLPMPKLPKEVDENV